MSLHTRVEDYIGRFSDVEALDIWLMQGARRLIDSVADEILEPYAQTYGFLGTSQGPSVGSYRVYSVAVGDRNATFIAPGKWRSASDPGSIYRATRDFPVWTWLNSRMNVTPAATTSFIATPKGTVAHRDASIPAVPPELEQAVVLYAAINGQLRQLNNTLAEGIGSLVFQQAGTIPSAPGAPAFTHTPGVSAVEIPTSVTTALTTAPTYTPPVRTIDFTSAAASINTDEDVELATAKVNEVATRIREFDSQVQAAVQDFQARALTYQQDVAARLKDAEMTLAALTASAQHSTDLSVRNADAETARQVAQYTALLNKYSTEVQAYLGVAQGEAQRFSAQVQRVGLDLQGMQAQLAHLRVLYMDSLQALGLYVPQQKEAAQ